MDDATRALLTPTLTSDVVATPYSVQSGFLVSFFGGPFAAVAWSLLNSKRLGRLEQDAGWQLLMIGVALAGFWALHGSPSLAALLDARIGGGFGRIAIRLLSVALFAGEYRLHRLYYRHHEMVAAKAPSPLLPAILCIVAGIGLEVALVMALH